MNGRVVADIRTRVEGERLHSMPDRDLNVNRETVVCFKKLFKKEMI
jgi:hypothetical protein